MGNQEREAQDEATTACLSGRVLGAREGKGGTRKLAFPANRANYKPRAFTGTDISTGHKE